MNFEKVTNGDIFGKITLRRGCISCGPDPLFDGGDVEDDGGASSDGGNNK